MDELSFAGNGNRRRSNCGYRSVIGLLCLERSWIEWQTQYYFY